MRKITHSFSRLRFRHKLFVLTLVAMIACGTGAVVLRGRSASAQDGKLTVGPLAAQQMALMAQMKATRTSAQKKIGSRLLIAQQKEAKTLPAILSTLRTSVEMNDAREPLVDIRVTNRTAVLKRFDTMKVQVVRDSANTLRAYVPFNLLETVAGLPEVVSVREPDKFFHNSSNDKANVNVAARERANGLAVGKGFDQRAAQMREKVRAALGGMKPKAGFPAFPMALNVSEGDKTHRAEDARNVFGVNGTGVKIGVISDGVDSLAALQASGDLPAGITVLSGQAGSGDEGSAMLEIVHDLAPGAQLYFATAAGGPGQFAQNIRDLAAAGCQIIVDDIIYLVESPLHDGQPTAGPGSGSVLGIVANAVNDVTAAGVNYFSSAGNEGQATKATSGTWEGNFVPNGTPGSLAGAGPVNNFGDGGQSILVESGGAGIPPLLHWADPLTTSANDYDLYVLNGALTTIFDASTGTQDGTGGDDEPIELIGGGAFAGERLVIAKFADDGNAANGTTEFLSLRLFRGELDDALATTGSTHGHSSSALAFSVAATPVANSLDGTTAIGPFPNPFTAANELESFSSDGPRRILFGANNQPITPGNVSATGGILRQKPDITAADGVSTAAPGFATFYGTSAAAPHAAAIAALLLSANPALTPAQVRTALISSAIDIEGPGVDRDSGAGIVMAYEALQAIGATPQAFLSLNSVVLTEAAGDNDGFAEPCERLNYSVVLANAGLANATAISAVLTSSTPGVVINQGMSAYPNLAASASASNTTPFSVTLPCSLACGVTVNFTLTVTYAGSNLSPQTITFSTKTGAPGTPVTFSYTGPAVPIPDGLDGDVPGAAANADLLVAGLPGNIFDLDFRFDGTSCTSTAGATTVGLDHRFVNDLQITLRAPDGTSVLVIDRTDGNGNNFCQTLLDDESAGGSIQAVVSANAPFTGSFKPNLPLSAFDALGGNGTWQLQAQDFFDIDTGNIRAFSLIITPAVCATAPCSLSQSDILITPGPGQTTAVVTYDPSITGGCGVVTCVPPSGSTFNLGVTPVVCTPQAGSPINFNVTLGCAPVTLGALTGSTAGTPYNQSAAASPAGSYTYSVMSGALPTGLTLNPTTGAVTGTPAVAGTFNFTLKAADNVNPCMGTRAYTLVITCPTVVLSPLNLPNGEVGTAYNQAIAASPAGGNYNYSVTVGSLPSGLTLNPTTGLISGSPTVTGNYAFTITATGFGSCTGFLNYTLLVGTCAPITVSPASLPGGEVGAAYNQTISAAPAGPYAYSVTSGVMPPGLSLNATTGVIAGTPATTGSFSFRVSAILDGCSGSRDYVVTIGCPAITLNPATIPAGQAGVAYSQTFSVLPAGGYTFSLMAGSLPSGLTLNPATGVISGTAISTGTSTFTVKAEGAGACSATRSYTLVMGCPTVSVNPAGLPGGTTGTAYSQTISASPAGGSYTYAVTSGSLPAGLNLNPATGGLSGTPTANGTFNFTVTATGFGGCTGTRSYAVTIGSGGCPTITLPATQPNGNVGTFYNSYAVASPSGSYNYTATGSLPPGTTLYNSIGLISGYPTAPGSYTFTVTATAGACSGSQTYTVIIGAGFASSLTVSSDFDGDGKSDLSVWRGRDGNWLVTNSGDGQLRSTSWGASYAPYNDVTVSGDYDGDGKTDLAVFRRGGDQAGYWYISRSSDGQVMRQHWGLGTDIPLPGDYDGDGKTDIAVWRGSAGAWYILRSSDGGVEGITWGIASVGDVPVPGDYDGDGKTDVAVFRRSDGYWHLKRSSDGIAISSKWGIGTDIAVPGDYDGDGRTDLAVFRASEGNWYIAQSGNPAILTRHWATGSQGDIPVPGDFDGDGKADFAVWNEPTGSWLVNGSRDDSTLSKSHGQSGDMPVMARRN